MMISSYCVGCAVLKCVCVCLFVHLVFSLFGIVLMKIVTSKSFYGRGLILQLNMFSIIIF